MQPGRAPHAEGLGRIHAPARERPAINDGLDAMSGPDSGLAVHVGRLAREFRGYEFGTCLTWDGRALIALRKGSLSRPGVCAVITDDVDEMREALSEPGPDG